MNSAKEMARCVASRSAMAGRATAWNFAAILPALSSRLVIHAMRSWDSACTITIAACRLQSSSTSSISVSLSFSAS